MSVNIKRCINCSDISEYNKGVISEYNKGVFIVLTSVNIIKVHLLF